LLLLTLTRLPAQQCWPAVLLLLPLLLPPLLLLLLAPLA
jgi:hypothetical protein